jgi:hypothetical protein
MPLLFLFLNFFVFQGAAFALNAVRARVKIEINQELALERQAFDLCLRINNGPGDLFT